MIGKNTRLLLNGICGGEEKANELIKIVDDTIATIAGGSLISAFALFQMCMIVTVGRSKLNSDVAIGLSEDGMPSAQGVDTNQIIKALALADNKAGAAQNYRAGINPNSKSEKYRWRIRTE